MRDSDGVASLEAQITYSRNGTYFDSGTRTFTSEEVSFPLEYTYCSTGKWSMRPGNILKSSSSNAHVNNVTTIPGGTYQQDLAFRAEMDRALPLHGMLQDMASQGVYSQVKFTNKNNRTESILEGERDWKNATICNRL